MKEQKFIELILANGDYAQYRTAHIEELIQKLVAAGVPFDATMATVDLMIWASRGNIKSYKYYAKRWGWTEGKARQFFIKHELNDAPEVWKINPKNRKMVQPKVQPKVQPNVQPKYNTKNGEIEEISDKYNTSTTQRTTNGTTNGTTPYINKEDRESISRVRVREIPTLAEVFEYCDFMSIKHEVGESFFDHYESVGWLNGLGIEIRNWKAALRKSNSKFSSQHRAQHHGTAITKTTSPSTNTRRQAITNDEFTKRTDASRQLVAAEMARRIAAESPADT